MAHSVCAWHCISDTFWRKVGSWMTIERKGEKKTGQESKENERQESKRRWWGGGEIESERMTPSVTDSHRVAQQVGGAERLHLAKKKTVERETHRSDCALAFAHEQCWTKEQPHPELIFTDVFLLHSWTSINKNQDASWGRFFCAFGDLSSKNITNICWFSASRMWRSAASLCFMSLYHYITRAAPLIKI